MLPWIRGAREGHVPHASRDGKRVASVDQALAACQLPEPVLDDLEALAKPGRLPNDLRLFHRGVAVAVGLGEDPPELVPLEAAIDPQDEQHSIFLGELVAQLLQARAL